MNVTGLDLSLTSTGVVCLQDGHAVVRTAIKSKPTGKNPKEEIARICNIRDSIIAIIEKNDPDVVVIEGLAFMSRNSTALVQLSGLNFMMRAYLFEKKKKFIIVAPTTLKKFVTGKGVAQKDQMMLESYKRWGISILDNNICDAYGLARIGLAALGKDDKITKTQKEVIDLILKQI